MKWAESLILWVLADWVEEAAKAAQIELTADEISRLERLGDETGVHTLREWEKEM